MGSRKTRGTLLSSVLAVGIAGAVTAAFAASDVGDEAPGKARAKRSNDVYIVRMAERPVVAYEGDLPGYAATKPRKGTKINPNDPKVVRYATYLDARHDDAVARVGGSKTYSYRYAFNGFAARLTAGQADALKSAPGVLSVEKDELYEMDTSYTPGFLGLSGAAGFWANTGALGENVIIGIVDSGVWPEHPSYSDRTGVNGNATQDGKLGYQQIPGWHGRCTPGEGFTGTDCNQKLIGARYYNAGWGGNAAIDEFFPFEFNSPRDWGGHGTHTSTTAGGNANVQATGPAAGLGKISGIAPRARIAAYKVCWADTPTGGGCFGSDSVAAIDQAVADGVDVINFSISGSQTNFRDAVEIAFMFAADAGVFVAASAGNAGTTGSVAHPGPWLTTVAAGTHNRDGKGSVTLGNGVRYDGASFSSALDSTTLIDAASAGLAGADPLNAERCFGAADNGGVAVLDPAKVAGRIVLCKRGVSALVNKSAAVAAAGGAGMVLYNDPAGATTLLALIHSVPAVHVLAADGLAIKAYISPAATASIAQATIVASATPAPLTATFSSRGPLTAGGGDVLKPDLMAPGDLILAGVAPPNNAGRLFDLFSGTSMSSPHVAGLAALFKEAHPEWSPMAIKSALMTTAADVLDGGTPPAAEANSVLIFRQGAGHVRPNAALNPGLVFDAGFNDWMSFICGVQPGTFCATIPAIDPSDLNLASIAIGDYFIPQTVTRRVKNVSGAAGTFTSSVNMPGFDVVVSPSVLSLASGASATFTVTFTRTTAARGSYAGGQLRWTNGTQTARVPLVVRPLALVAPALVTAPPTGASYQVKFGYDGTFAAAARGLIAPQLTSGTVADDPTNGTCSLTSPNAQLIPVVVPAGTTFARFSLFDADVTPGADIDLCVFRGTTLVGSSGSGTSAEEVNIVNPTAATNYTVVVHGWGVASGTPSPFKLHTWLLGGTSAGNMNVSAPATAVAGGTGTIVLTFTGLAPATKYLGSVAYTLPVTGGPNPTIVRVDTP